MENFVWPKSAIYVKGQGWIFVLNVMETKNLMVRHAQNVMAEALSNVMHAVAEESPIEWLLSTILSNNEGD